MAGDGLGAGARGRASSRGPRAAASAPHPQRARRRPLRHGRADDHSQPTNGKAERLHPSLPIAWPQPPRRAASAAPRPHVLRDGGAGGRPLEAAIVVGIDPLTLLASQAIAPIDVDELEIAGALHRRPLSVVKCLTSDLRVPAEAEIVIEGRLLPGVRAPEGPFGEFPQYYGERAERHVMEIDAVTHRKDAIFHTIVGGGLEHLLLGAIPREATLLAHLQRSLPNVRDVHLSRGGACRYHLYVQIRKRQEGEAKNIMLGAFAGHYDVKHVIVVDEDV